jgi:signal transduction histidine kinase
VEAVRVAEAVRAVDKVCLIVMQYDEASARRRDDRDDDPRLEGLALFASGVVHDLRNPLNVISANAYLIRQRLSPEDERMARALARIDDQVVVALQILENLQLFYKVDRYAPQRLDLNEVVRSAVQSYRFPTGFGVDLRLTENLPSIEGDLELLPALIRNLLRNSVQALPEGGTISVGTRKAGEAVELVVTDEGVGIPEDALPRVTEPFFTTDPSRAGLGLYGAAAVVRAHGGTLDVASELDEGTEVIVRFPTQR